jgi:hypothetical protein
VQAIVFTGSKHRRQHEKALHEVCAAESRKMAQVGYPPLRRESRWCALRRGFRLLLLSGECSAVTAGGLLLWEVEVRLGIARQFRS